MERSAMRARRAVGAPDYASLHPGYELRGDHVDETRRRFLKATGIASTVSMLSKGLSTPAQAQADRSAAPASVGRGPADLVLKHGKIVTVDAAFTIAQAIAVAGE